MSLTFAVSYWGGMNVREQADFLTARSHQFVQNVGWAQMSSVGIESPSSKNMDFDPQGIRKRLGSTSWNDLTSALVASEVLLGGFQMVEATSGDRIVVVVGKKSIYTNQSGSFVQINDSASATYTHAADASQFSVVFLDGRAFIGLDGANQIQVYQGGADLNPEMANGNSYTDSGGTLRTISGTWGTGAYILAAIHNRLAFSTGDNVFEYTPMAHTSNSGVWDLGGSTAGAYFAANRIKMMATFTPFGGDDEDAMLYVGTDQGLEVTTGFTLPSDHSRELPHAEAPINHKAWCRVLNWLVYLTETGNLLGVNGMRVIDLGARLRSPKNDGPLDGMNLTQAATDAFGFYHRKRSQAMFWFPTDSAYTNDTAVVVDLSSGEPVPGEQPDSFERRVRLLRWQVKEPGSNAWFSHVFHQDDGPVGVISTGPTYTLGSTNYDLDALAIEATHKTPVFTGGGLVAVNVKQFFRQDLTTIPTGAYSLTVNLYFERDTDAADTFTFAQVAEPAFILDVDSLDTDLMGEAGIVKEFHRVRRRAEAVQAGFENLNGGETFILATMALAYDVGAQHRS